MRRVAAHGLSALSALALAPAGLLALGLRPSWRRGLRERVGALPRLPPGAIWIHGASVGEIRAASRLVDRLRKRGHTVVTSTVTQSGRALMRATRPEIPCFLAPLDHPWCVASALARARPAALVLIETELWPCWIAAAARRGIPVVLVSGRVSDRSFPRYRRVAWIVGAALRRIETVGARTAVDAERLVALGADADRVAVTGDLKLEREEERPPLAGDLARALEGAPLFVAGSTHPGEEVAALSALATAERAGLAVAAVIAPRHTERASEVARLVRSRSRPLRRRSLLGPGRLQPGEVLLLDTLGELPSVYERGAAAFVGGTLAPLGGHNVLEPVFAGCPVLYGRHTANVRHAVEILAQCGAGRRVEDAGELGSALVELLRDPAASRACGEAGRAALLCHRGSADRAAGLVEDAIARRGAAPARAV